MTTWPGICKLCSQPLCLAPQITSSTRSDRRSSRERPHLSERIPRLGDSLRRFKKKCRPLTGSKKERETYVMASPSSQVPWRSSSPHSAQIAIWLPHYEKLPALHFSHCLGASVHGLIFNLRSAEQP